MLLEKYDITPAPNVVELDRYEYGAELQSYLTEKSGRRTVPNVLVGKSFESRGGCDEFEKLHKDNDLIKLLVEWGLVVYKLQRRIPHQMPKHFLIFITLVPPLYKYVLNTPGK